MDTENNENLMIYQTVIIFACPFLLLYIHKHYYMFDYIYRLEIVFGFIRGDAAC